MIEIFPDKDLYTTRQLLNACLEKSNLRANLQSGETASINSWRAKQAERERASEQWSRETSRDSPKWRACPKA